MSTLRPPHDELLERAENLVPMTGAFAIGEFVPHLDRFPQIKDSKVENWDFLLTVAGTFAAIMRLRTLDLDPKDEQQLIDVIFKSLSTHYPDGLAALDDCWAFFDRTRSALASRNEQSKFDSADALGSWVVWNLLDGPPQTDSDLMLSRTIGALLIHGTYGWWAVNG